MDTDDLLLFADVVRAGSFAAVAKVRGVDPSTVSRAVAQLEDRLGVRLFQRTTRRMSLTEAGARVLDRAVPLADDLSALRAELREGRNRPRGHLRLTASVSYGQARILPLLPEFRRSYPEVTLDCVFTDATLDLVAERIDLGVRMAPAIDGDLVAARLHSTRYRVVASPRYLAARGRPSRPEDIVGHDCLLFTLRDWRDRWRFRDADGRDQVIPVEGAIHLAPASALRDAACAGLGLSLLADWLVDRDIEAGRLVDVFPDHDVTATAFDTAAWLVYPSRTYLPGKTRAMADFLKENL